MLPFNQKPPLSDTYYTIGKMIVGFTVFILVVSFIIPLSWDIQPVIGIITTFCFAGCFWFAFRVLWNAREELLAFLMIVLLVLHVLSGLVFSFLSFQAIREGYSIQAIAQISGIIAMLVSFFDIVAGICFFIKGFKRGKHLVLMGAALCFFPLTKFSSNIFQAIYFHRNGDNVEFITMLILVIISLASIILLIAIFNLLHQEQKVQQKTIKDTFDERIF